MDGAMGPADMLIGAGLAHNSITAVAPRSTAKARALAASLEGVEDQLVRAVFVRIAVLSRGEAVGNALIRSDIAAGHALVPVLAARLRFFEQHRAEYGTLAQYLPTLVAGLPRPKADAKAADDAQLASCAPAVTPVR
jgi:hypothetical protein